MTSRFKTKKRTHPSSDRQNEKKKTIKNVTSNPCPAHMGIRIGGKQEGSI
jgi:hypothetical protein